MNVRKVAEQYTYVNQLSPFLTRLAITLVYFLCFVFDIYVYYIYTIVIKEKMASNEYLHV